MATVKLYNVQEQKLVNYELSIENDEIVATYKDSFLKFPGGLTKKQFDKLVEEHNKVNKDQVPLSAEELEGKDKIQKLNTALLDSLE